MPIHDDNYVNALVVMDVDILKYDPSYICYECLHRKYAGKKYFSVIISIANT